MGQGSDQGTVQEVIIPTLGEYSLSVEQFDILISEMQLNTYAVKHSSDTISICSSVALAIFILCMFYKLFNQFGR